jgi:phosphoribosylformylglycinamidine cyclo-ligase
VEALVSGIADGCRQAGCALIGGEMAEHPGVMGPGEFELVGFSVGAVERGSLITGERVAVGDALIGLPSPNLRSNGYSLARRVMFELAGRSLEHPAWDGAEVSVADALLEPSVIYTPAVLAVAEDLDVRAIAHITGGGLPGNLDRVLPAHTDARVDTDAWEVPPIFAELQRLGGIAASEMYRVFNMGVGMVLVMPETEVSAALSILASMGHGASVVGEITRGSGRVRLDGVDT